ncbi:MAG: histone deacetylase [Litorilinea sp.]
MTDTSSNSASDSISSPVPGKLARNAPRPTSRHTERDTARQRNAASTALAYDPFNLRHTQRGHPENARRLEETWKLLQIDGIANQLLPVELGLAPERAVLRVHTQEYWDRLYMTSILGGGRLDPDTYSNEDSFEAAQRAAGSTLHTIDAVLTAQVSNGFALVRPPGHHALAETAMGFCLLANVAIAARWAQDQYGVDRILIVDFDVHHGNGTQDIFYGDPSVLFFSMHQYPYYPGSGGAQEIGRDPASGSTINVPFAPGVGDHGYLEALHKVLIPAARRFQPELILVSAGYDSHWMDPLAEMQLSVRGYTQLLETLLELAEEVCDGRLVATLEGGYHAQVLSHAVLSALRLLSGSRRGVSDPFGLAPGRERPVAGLLEQLCSLHHLPEPPTYSFGRS